MQGNVTLKRSASKNSKESILKWSTSKIVKICNFLCSRKGENFNFILLLSIG